MKKFTLDQKLDFAKKATKIVVGYGTGIIATGIIVNNVTPKNVPQKVGVVVAGVVITMMCREQMVSFTEYKFNQTVDAVKQLLKKEDEPTVEPVEA